MNSFNIIILILFLTFSNVLSFEGENILVEVTNVHCIKNKCFTSIIILDGTKRALTFNELLGDKGDTIRINIYRSYDGSHFVY